MTVDISYVTLTELKRQWETQNPANATLSNPVMMEYARRASAKVDHITGMEFAPRIETRYYDTFGLHIDTSRNTIMLDKPIVELTTTVLADSTSLTTDTDVRLYPRGATPAIELQIYYPNTNYWTQYTNDPQQSIAITGVWCWRDRYATDGWKLSGDSVQDAGGINAAVTTVTVTDADGTNWIGDTPRFDLGQLLKVESEYMTVTAVNTTTQALTVVRGVRGSTAAIHAKDVAISVFTPNPDIVRATQLIAFYDYARRGTITQATFDGLAVTQGLEVPGEVNDILNRYKSAMKWMVF